MDITVLENRIDESLIDACDLNATVDLNNCHMKWKHLKLNSR